MTSAGFPFRPGIAVAALAGLAALITSCSGGGSSATPPAQVTKPATQTASPRTGATARATATATASGDASPTAAAAPSGPQPCATARLTATIGSGEGAAGSSYYPIDLTNNSGTTCTLYGYPGVSFVTAVAGRQIGAAATRNGTFAPALVTLTAGQAAHATLQVVNASNYPAAQCKIVQAHWLRVYPPGQFSPLYVSFSAPTCGGGARATGILSVQTMRPGASGP
jgi:hypothetical protein